MRRRVRRAEPARTEDRIEIVPVEAAAFLTLEDPAAEPEAARGAFARLRPPEGTSPDVVASWRESVARVARAVRVVAAPRSADVSLASTRVDADARVGSVREEATALAAETKDADVVALVAALLDEVGA